MSASPFALRLSLAFALHLACGVPASWAQIPRYHLAGGGLTSCAGGAGARSMAIVGESGTGIALARSSNASADVIGGFLGQAFASRATARLEPGEREYAAIAFPLNPAERSVESVLESLGEPDIASWRLGHWSTSDSAYVEVADGGLTTVARGLGYFLITADPEEIGHHGLTAPVGDFEITLDDGPGGRPGYNQLGNPFLFPVAVSDLMVTDGTRTLPLIGDLNTLTEAAVKVYESGSGAYATNPGSIAPLGAFWVKKLAPGPVSVIMPFRAGAAESEEASARPAGAQWAVAVTARQGARACEPVVVGAAAISARGWNPLCVSRAPDPPGGGLSLAIHQSQWGRNSGDYVRVLGPGSSAQTWDLMLRGAESPGEIALKVDGFDLPASARVTLIDLVSGEAHSASSGGTITMAARAHQSVRLIVTLDGDPGSGTGPDDRLRYVYPNPFRRSTGLVFAHAGGGAFDARVFDVSGRLIRELRAPANPAGERVLVWDGRDGAGGSVAPGVYLVRYRVGNSRGVTRVVKLD